MTLDVYNSYSSAPSAEHCASFDRLIRNARTQLFGDEEPPADVICADVCADTAKTPSNPVPRADRGQARTYGLAGRFVDGETRTRTGDTTIFSRVLYQLSYLAAGRSSAAPMLPASRSRQRARARARVGKLARSGAFRVGCVS
jgi:hypothetical protein